MSQQQLSSQYCQPQNQYYHHHQQKQQQPKQQQQQYYGRQNAKASQQQQQVYNDHQQHHRRAGVEVTPSGKSYAESQMKRALDIETQLITLTNTNATTGKDRSKSSASLSSTEEMASKLRMQLCELLSDMLLTEPSFALQNDCIGRLWRLCFYTPIGQFRSRISREKKRRSSIGNKLEQKQQQSKIQRLEKQLYHFLAEAVTLYDYLVSQYQYKLIRPSDASQASQSQSQSLSLSASQSQHNENGDDDSIGRAIVKGLYKMYIHLGDLHRYSTAYGKAQACYLKAAKLAPGHGNPYNQLAVVAQLKDTAAPLNCVAFYWYARSLLTTYDSFGISKANLARMFQSNRDWLQQQQHQDSSTITSDTTDNTKNNSSRIFLAKFVDLHYSFFQTDVETNNIVTGATLQQLFIQSFSSLLKASAFGDSLLCKMVAVHAFSECYHRDNKVQNVKSSSGKSAGAGSSQSRANSDGQKYAGLSYAARLATLSFGTCLAYRVGNERKHSHRLLLPLLLLCEYIESCPLEFEIPGSDDNVKNSVSTTIQAKLREITHDFGANLVQVMNRLQPLRQDTVTSGALLKEYKNMLGFSPFLFLKNANESLVDGFLPASEASNVLELNVPSSSTQESAAEAKGTSINSGLNASEENKIKVSRILDFGQRLAKENTTELSRNFVYDSYQGVFQWGQDDGNRLSQDKVETATDTKADTIMRDDMASAIGPPESTIADPEDDGGDFLVYSPEGGVAPLDPRELLKQQQQKLKQNMQAMTENSPVERDVPSCLAKISDTTPASTAAGSLGVAFTETIGRGKETHVAAVDSTNFSETAMPPASFPALGTPSIQPNKSTELMEVDQLDEKSPSPNTSTPKTATLPPPPGFGPPPAAAATATSTNINCGIVGSTGISGSVQVGITAPNAPSQPQAVLIASPRAPGFSHQPTPLVPPSLPPPSPAQLHFLNPSAATDHNVLGLGGLQLFGGPTALQTANPFASATISAAMTTAETGNIIGANANNHDGFGRFTPFNNAYSHQLNAGSFNQSTNFLGQPAVDPSASPVGLGVGVVGGAIVGRNTSLAETSFLDSGLINSLWMDDNAASNKTKNPFAT